MNYDIRYVAGAVFTVISLVAGGIAGYQHFVATAPAWLTPDIAGTCAIIAGIAGALAGYFASLGLTPKAREASYLSAMAGKLPDDLQKKYPTVLVKGNTPEV